jgi:MYXO-CTERM domain-containing protein
MRSLLSSLCLLLVPAAAQAATLTVDDSGGAQHTTISAAIAAASPGDIVQVAAGTYTEDLDFSGKAITVRGTAGPASTFLIGTGSGPVVRFVSAESNNATLQGFDISGGDTRGAYQGAGIHVNNAGPTLRDLVVHDNLGHLGAGVFLGDAVNAVLDDLVIRDNTSSYDANGDWGYGGGLYGFDCTATLTDVLFEGNEAPRGGGFMFGGCTVTLDGVTVRANDAERGGGFSLLGGTTTMTNALIEANTASINGGGFWFSVDAAGSFLSVVVSDNVAPTGAGGRITNSSPTLEHVTFSGNVSTTNGGGLFVDAIDDDADVTLLSCLFDGNEATVGGGLLVSAGSVAVWGSRFSGNSAGNLGGAVYLSDAAPSTFSLTTFDGNSSGSDGGAVRVQGEGPHAFESCVFADNTGTNGAAVHIGFGGDASLQHCTLVGHAASSGGALRVTGDSSMTVLDSIVAFAAQGSGISSGEGATWDVTYNDVFNEVGPGYSGAMPDLTGFEGMIAADPLFVDYTPNGVWDDDLQLASGSPAIDAGAPASDTDADGSPTDMGAFGGPNSNAWSSLPEPGALAAGSGDDDDSTPAGDDDDSTAAGDDDDSTAAGDDDDSTGDDDDGTGTPFEPTDTPPIDDGGCGCTQGSDRATAPALLLLALIAGVRRRRAS